jgi:hypothetical protein
MNDNPDLLVEVQESKRRLIVTMPPTRFSATFTVPQQTGVFARFDYVPDDADAPITIDEFSRRAEAVARTKARELGWLKQPEK